MNAPACGANIVSCKVWGQENANRPFRATLQFINKGDVLLEFNGRSTMIANISGPHLHKCQQRQTL